MDSAISFLLFFLFVCSSVFSLVRCGLPPWSLPGVNPLTLLSVIVPCSLWWAGAVWLCRRNASAHVWLYVFGLSSVHHPKSLCKLFIQGVLEDVALAWMSSSGSHKVPCSKHDLWFGRFTSEFRHSVCEHQPPQLCRLIQIPLPSLQRLCALRVWITPCSFSAK